MICELDMPSTKDGCMRHYLLSVVEQEDIWY